MYKTTFYSKHVNWRSNPLTLLELQTIEITTLLIFIRLLTCNRITDWIKVPLLISSLGSLLVIGGIKVFCHFPKIDLMSIISCLTSLTFWTLFHVVFVPFCSKTNLGPKFLNKLQFVYYFGQTDKFPNIFHFNGTLLPSCVNRRYNSNVTGRPSHLKILHYKVLQEALSFLHNIL